MTPDLNSVQNFKRKRPKDRPYQVKNDRIIRISTSNKIFEMNVEANIVYGSNDVSEQER